MGFIKASAKVYSVLTQGKLQCILWKSLTNFLIQLIPNGLALSWESHEILDMVVVENYLQDVNLWENILNEEIKNSSHFKEWMANPYERP